MFRATIFTLYPDFFPGPLGQSLSGDALARGLWALETRQIRDHGLGRHKSVDDTPAGGGPGMVIRADVLAASLDAGLAPDDPRPRLLMSPRGRPLTQNRVRELAQGADLLIHDSQYTESEFAVKSNWGHCTIDYALWLAGECNVRTLALFHHDPGRTDDALDELHRRILDEADGEEVLPEAVDDRGCEGGIVGGDGVGRRPGGG